MKMEEQKSICLSGRPMDFLLSSVPGKNGCSAFPHPDDQPACGKDRDFFHGENHRIMGSRGEFPALLRPGKDLSMMSARRRNLFRQGGMRSDFLDSSGKSKEIKGMKDSRYPPPDAAGKGEE